MKTLRSLLKSNEFFYLFFTILILSISFLPILYRIQITPPDRSYTGAVFYTDDYAVYTSVIEQGIQGRWTVLDKFTSEPHPSSLIHFHYLILGKIGKIAGLSSIITYHTARIVTAGLFLLTLIFLLYKIVPGKYRRLTFLLILFSSGWPKLSQSTDALWQKFIPQFIEPDPAIRLVHQPHFLLGSLYTLCTILIVINPSKYITKAKLFLFLLLTGYTCLADPAQTVTALSVFFLTSICMLMYSNNKVQLKHHLMVFFVAVLGSSPVLLYLKWIRTQEPWKTIAFFDTIQEFPPTLTQFFLSFGPLAIFAAIGIVLYIVRRKTDTNKSMIVSMCWIVTVSILIFILSEKIGINRNRIFHTPLYIPLSIIASYAIYTVSLYVKKYMEKIPLWMPQTILSAVVVCIGIPVFIAGIIWQINEHEPTVALIYPPKTHIEAFTYFNNNSKSDDVVLCLYEACNQIPFYSGNTVFLGNISETINERYKSDLARKIFAGVINNEELKNTLESYRIKYIFLGYQENSGGADFAKYPFVKKVFQNSGVTIFENTLNIQ